MSFAKKWLFLMAVVATCVAQAQLTFRNSGPVETDSQGHVIEKLDYDRKIVATNGLPSAAEFRAEMNNHERMKKVAQKVGPWFDSIQRLELDQKKSEEKNAADGGGEAGDATGYAPGYSGPGMMAYIEALRLFNTNTEEGGALAKDARQLKAALDELLYRRGGEVLCGPSHGVSIKYPLELLLVRYQSWKAQRLPMDELYPAKSADLWPGKVPEDAERVTKKVTLYPGEGGYISTGLYVPPGEIITIKAGSLTGNLTAQIGCHTDALDPKIVPFDENGQPMDDPYDPVAPNLMKVKMGWQQVTDNRPLWRWPDMVRRFQITKKKQEIGHVLGGVLWLSWSGGNRPMTVEISGCVQMPWFRLGLDTNEEWVNKISKYPAPWAEVQTKNIIFTVEAKYVRDITDMVSLCQWWGKAACIMLRTAGQKLPTDGEAKNYRGAKREWGILDKKLVQMNEDAPPDSEELTREMLKTNPQEVDRYGFAIKEEPVPQDPRAPKALKKPSREDEPKFTPIRIVDDTQISIGAGHSGYPIMCLTWGPGMMNLKGVQKNGSWGALHEIGHNMGQGANGIFSLPNNGEVICNFYGTCVMNLLNGTRFTQIKKEKWDTVAQKVAEGTPNLWTVADVFERLVFYMTLAHHFGVESVIAVVNDKSDKYPTEAIGDRLCCAWSTAVKRDLTPYFEMWGLPLSKGTYTRTQDWVPWPSEAEKAVLFGVKEDRYNTGEEPIVIDNPEDMKTRRQLRARANFKKTVTE